MEYLDKSGRKIVVKESQRKIRQFTFPAKNADCHESLLSFFVDDP